MSTKHQSEYSSEAKSGSVTVQEAFTRSGGYGRYQYFMLLCLILGNNGPGFVVYGVSYFELDPPYLCTYNVNADLASIPDNAIISADQHQITYTVECDKETVCDKKRDLSLISYEIDKSSKYYIYNWVEQKHLTCVSSGYIGAMGSFGFLGSALACLFLPHIGDKYGRLMVYRVTIFSTIFVLLLLNLGNHIGAIYIANFCLGVALIGRFTCGFVLITESAPKNKQNFVGVLFAFGDTIVTIYVTILLRFATNDSRVIVWIGFTINILAFILVLFLTESPTWMAALGHEEHAAKAFAYIAKFNGVSDFAGKVQEVRPDKFGEDAAENKANNSKLDKNDISITSNEISKGDTEFFAAEAKVNQEQN